MTSSARSFRQASCVTQPGGATSAERVARIIALDADPVRRNLLITQCYHDLSAALAHRLGAENANWCTFATWASRTAGRFIRDEEVPAAFREVLLGSPRLSAAVGRANKALGWSGRGPMISRRRRSWPSPAGSCTRSAS